ncbi:MAG TPA: hypothetical protein VJX92_06885 [Methylomirabilota bacterium]|nr:hypothetical protein [Methylomirabilota bacterium]
MDQINLLKGRMAEALVEGVFRRSKYTVARVGRETQVPALIRTGRAEFMPDFVVWRALDELGHHPYRLLAVEVKYRANLEGYLRHGSPSWSADTAQQWPELYEIIVTDRPEPGHSCFQVFHASAWSPGASPDTRDLLRVPGLDIDRRTVEEYEGLVREIFPVLGSRSGTARSDAGECGRKPPTRMAGRGERRGHGQPRSAADPQPYFPVTPSEHRHGVSE